MQQRQEPQWDPADPVSSSDPAATTPAATRPRRRWLRWLLISCLSLLLALCALLGLGWWWAGQSDSLGRTLARIASWMPADQKLEADGIEGSLRGGGRIDWLRWSSPALQVEIKGADIAWRLQPLLSRELRFGRVNMQELRIRSTPQPKDDAPTQPLQSLQLPMRIDVPVRIERLVWEGPPETTVNELYGHYRYNGSQHDLEVTSLRYAGGFYEGEVQLQAAAPMALQAQLKGSIEAPLPNQPDQQLQVLAQASVTGTLATEAAQLHIKAQAHTPQADADKGKDAAQTLSADVSATVRPWRPQPIEQAQAQLRHVDVALFWPDGPRTDLNGSVQAGPQGEGWQLQADLRNDIAAPWDRQGLPVRHINANVSFDGIATWLLHNARVDVGDKGDAHILAQGRFDAQSQAVEGQAQLHAVNPAQLYSSLDASPLSGQLQAQTDAQQNVQFALDVQAATSRSSQSLQIQAVRAQGTWQAPLLQVRDVYVNALNAQLQSSQLQWHADKQHLQGKLQAQVPGSQAQLDMDGGPNDGKGQLHFDISAANSLADWLRQLPLSTDPLAGTELQGQADAQLSWQGGWAKLLQRLQDPTAARQASGLRLQAAVHTPQLTVQPAQGDAITVEQLKLTLAGSPEQLQTELSGNLQLGQQKLDLQATANAGLSIARGAAATDWQATLQSLRARLQAGSQSSQPWTVQLAEPVQLSQLTTGNPVRRARIQASAGRLQLSAPEQASDAKAADVQWEPLLLRQAANGSWGVQTQGRLRNVPLAWVDAFSPQPQKPLLASAGISGDLVVQGTWDIDNTGRNLRAQVLVERASGDIRLSVEDSDAAPITMVRSSGASEVNTQTQQIQSRTVSSARGLRARLQELRLEINTDNNEVAAQLVWNSERAGQLQANVRSQIRSSAQGLSWPENAPISGNLKAALPNVGIWALFAPPGWRVTGTLQADVAISGTRTAPQWSGQVNADQLSVLSLLDGVDLKNGRLRAQLQATRLDITELYLEGGEGSSTRILGQSGNLTSAPQSGGTLTGQGFVAYDPNTPEGSSGISMDIQAVAQQLQVLVRADRQLSVSGDLRAGMNNGQVTLRSDLEIDRAAILLADESAPKLDADVYVTSAASRQAAQAKAEQDATRSAGAVQAAQPPDIQINLDLGRDFALQGYGITTRLEGQLQIANGPKITGEIHTVNGRYRAWGQSLDVESGTIRFSGPYANPAIDIIAIRPNIEVRAGAKVTGSANNPRVALFSEPDMSDAEKLSWIVMGRSAAAGGAETALLQQAALAMLSGGGGTGNFAANFGLDEIGLKGPSEDGEQGAAVTLGKRLSQDFYVAYEQSLNGAMGTLYIFYELSRRLTLRGQTGEQTAVDLIYTRAKD